jgi:TP53 regulating kinase-like protein
MDLISQGAEAHLYKTTFLNPSLPAALKIRPQKPWRHPTLDRRLTRARLLAEARVLVKCRRENVPVPAVYSVDWEGGWMCCEWIEGGSVKEGIRGWEKLTREKPGSSDDDDDAAGGVEDGKEGTEAALKDLLRRMGETVGRLHSSGVIHGDLTTSNMMLRRPASSSSPSLLSSSSPTSTSSGPSPSLPTATSDSLSGTVVLIDFGLATQSLSEEDRAVDLYVLERAFGSTHPRQEGLFREVIAAYEGSYKGAKGTVRKLEEVRMRGRKKSMLG